MVKKAKSVVQSFFPDVRGMVGLGAIRRNAENRRNLWERGPERRSVGSPFRCRATRMWAFPNGIVGGGVQEVCGMAEGQSGKTVKHRGHERLRDPLLYRALHVEWSSKTPSQDVMGWLIT